MAFLIFTRKQIGTGLIACTVICVFLQNSQAQSREKVTQTTLSNKTYTSALGTLSPVTDTVHYTIQICTMDHDVKDFFFKGNSKIRIIRMGDLYRYIFSQYRTLDKAREDLLQVRKLYPQAFIREYKHGNLGQAIDLNIDQIRINH